MVRQTDSKRQFTLREKVEHYKRIVKRYDNSPNKYKNRQYMYARGFLNGINNSHPRFDYEFLGKDFVNGMSAYERSVWKEVKQIDFKRDMQMIHDSIYGK